MSTKVTNTTAIIDGTTAVVHGMNALIDQANDPASIAEAVRDIMLMAGIARLGLHAAASSDLVDADAIKRADAIIANFVDAAAGLGEEE